MERVVGEYHAVWLLLPIDRGAVQELLPTTEVPGLHLQPYSSIPIDHLPANTHPVLLEIGKEHNCGPEGFRGLFRSSFHECKLEIPYVQHPQCPGEPLCYKALVLVDKLLNAFGSERLYGIRTLRASFRSSLSDDGPLPSPSADAAASEAPETRHVPSSDEDMAVSSGPHASSTPTVGEASKNVGDVVSEAQHSKTETQDKESDFVCVEHEEEFLELKIRTDCPFAAADAALLQVYTDIVAQRWFGGAKAKALQARQERSDPVVPRPAPPNLDSDEPSVEQVDENVEKKAEEIEEALMSPRWGRKGTAEPIPNPAVKSKGKKRGKAAAVDATSPRLPSSLSSSFIYRVDLKGASEGPVDAHANDDEEEEEGDGWSTDSAAYDSVGSDEEGKNECTDNVGEVTLAGVVEALADESSARSVLEQSPESDAETVDIQASLKMFEQHLAGNEDLELDLGLSAHIYDLEKMRVRPVCGVLEMSRQFWTGSDELFLDVRGAGLQVFETDTVSGNEKEPSMEIESPQNRRRKASFFSKFFSRERPEPPRQHIRFSGLSPQYPYGAVQVVAPFAIERR